MMPIKRREPSPGQPQWDKAFYPDPPSHDFCVWLIIAELMRRYHNAPAPLKVKFGLQDGQLGCVDYGPMAAFGGFGYACNVTKEYSDLMIKNVLRPAIEMIGAVEVPSVSAPFDHKELSGWVEYDYHIGHLVDAGREGHDIPKWKPPQWAFDEVDEFLKGVRPVIITLRECEGQPERNSKVGAWLDFGNSIRGQYQVLFLRDTCKADNPDGGLPGFSSWPRASKNVYVRAALYQRALVNMMVCNGPNTWCIFSDAPYLIFKQLVPELPNWHHGQPWGWFDQDHMHVGDQYPWASPLQRFTWTDDTFRNIQGAFNGFLAMQDTLAA